MTISVKNQELIQAQVEIYEGKKATLASLSRDLKKAKEDLAHLSEQANEQPSIEIMTELTSHERLVSILQGKFDAAQKEYNQFRIENNKRLLDLGREIIHEEVYGATDEKQAITDGLRRLIPLIKKTLKEIDAVNGEYAAHRNSVIVELQKFYPLMDMDSLQSLGFPHCYIQRSPHEPNDKVLKERLEGMLQDIEMELEKISSKGGKKND